jgi:shikimate 5-dehydrogenase
VDVSEREWERGAMEVLRRLGLRFAAVTSPLKPRAFALAEQSWVSQEASALRTANTLAWDPRSQAWHGTNTDILGLESLLASFRELDPVAIWGAGGTLEAIRGVVPNALAFGARSGKSRADGRSAEEFAPSAVIWGVGRSRVDEMKWPPEQWRPQVVIDLNYSEDSPGREYAMSVGAQYVSGIVMFHRQGEGQRKFWGKYEQRR